MKANNINSADLANWINFQLSTIIEGVSAGYTLGNNSTVWIDRGATVFTVSLATGEEIEVNSDDYNTAEDIAKAIISTLNKNTTPSTSDTMNTETTPVEFSELSHAGQCTDIYLHNTAEIYQRYTVPAIARVVKAYKAGECVSVNPEQLAKDIQEITPAINAAVRLVKRYDHMTPTAKDIEQVTRNYAAYIVESAKYEVENA